MRYFLKTSVLLFLFTIISCGQKKQTKTETKTAASIDTAQNIAIPVGKKPDALFLAANYNKIYVANSEDDFLSVIDTKTDSVIGKIAGVKGSWGFSPIPQKPLVALSTNRGQIALINFEHDRIEKEKTFDYAFGDVISSTDGKFLYVVAITVKKVIKINPETLLEEDSYDTGGEPDGIEISADGTTLFVTNRADGTISAIDLKENKTGLIKTGGKPELINANQDHSLVFASNFELNAMHIIDTKTKEVQHSISGLNGPEGAYADAKMLYISNFNSNEVSAYATNDFSKLVKTYSTGKNPLSIIETNGKLYVSCYGSNSVSVIKL